MTRTVADAAALLTVISGTDPEDPATVGNPLEGRDFAADLSPDALRGARIGVVAEQTPQDGTDERVLWDAALEALAGRGAELVDLGLEARRRYDVASPVLSHEFKRDLDAYLTRLPEGAPVRTLAEVIARNEAQADVALKLGQTLALAAQARDLAPDSVDTPSTGPPAPETWRRARTASTP